MEKRLIYKKHIVYCPLYCFKVLYLILLFLDPTATEGDDKEEEDEDKYVDEVDMPGTKVRYF